MGAEVFGKYYWCLKVSRKISVDGEIYVYADCMHITRAGTLEALGKDGTSNLTIAKGMWYAYFLADDWDGSPFAVEWWEGQIKNVVRCISGANAESDSKQKPSSRHQISKSMRFDVMRRDNFTCRLCGAIGKDTPLEVDHIIPHSKGGSATLDNLQTLCINCNRGKKAKMAVVTEEIM